MKYVKTKVYTAALLLLGSSLVAVYGFASADLFIANYTIQGVTELLRSIFVQHWYFGAGLAILSVFIISMYYGEKQQEITISAEHQDKGRRYNGRDNRRI